MWDYILLVMMSITPKKGYWCHRPFTFFTGGGEGGRKDRV